jgi:hypothetical protein
MADGCRDRHPRRELLSPPSTAGDADQIGQVVINLLVNAHQAVAERPHPRAIRVESRLASPGRQRTRRLSARRGQRRRRASQSARAHLRAVLHHQARRPGDRREARVTGDTLAPSATRFLKETGLPWLEKPLRRSRCWRWSRGSRPPSRRPASRNPAGLRAARDRALKQLTRTGARGEARLIRRSPIVASSVSGRSSQPAFH